MSLILRHNSKINRNQDGMNLDINPSPAILCSGISAYGDYWIEDDGKPMKQDKNKPPYIVPTMAEIKELPWNGYKVASTFSGAGGSCTGYRMAGYKVIWANEFVPAAQDSYNANKSKDCYLDKRDIRQVKAQDILKQTGLKEGELDLFDGSPPCQAFSTAGKREKGWGKGKKYEHGVTQCNEQLFDDYIRLLRGLMPKTFVAENVSGLLKGTAKGMFLQILKDLKESGYNVKCKLLDAQWLGVPQMRQRAIFIGVRNDLDVMPVYPLPLKYRYSVRDAIEHISFCDIGKGFGEFKRTNAKDTPYQSFGCSPSSGNGKAINIETTTGEKRKFTIAELKKICSFPDDFILKGSYAQQWERIGNSVPPVMMYHISKVIRDEILTKTN